MGTMGIEVFDISSVLTNSDEVTVASYDPFSQGEQVYLGSMDVEVGFTRANMKTDQQFDSDDLAKFFIKVPILHLCGSCLS
jgi:hypothetical protein